MLVRRLSPKEVAAEMGCSVATARARMRQIVHTEKPLTVTESEISMWYEKREYHPVEDQKRIRTYCRHMAVDEQENYLIPRRRSKK